MKKRAFSILLFFYCCINFSHADHILGGVMQYQYLDNNNYRIFIKVYLDNATQTPADMPLPLSVYRELSVTDYELLNTISISPTSVTSISTRKDDCVSDPFPFDLVEVLYETDITLPDAIFDYHFVYQRCCLPNTITNVVDPKSVGLSIHTEITMLAQELNNSSPDFITNPFFEVCANDSFNFDLEAMDSNADSLVINFCTVSGGGGPFGTPQNPGDPNACDGVAPSPPCPPSFFSIPLINPFYSYFSALGADSEHSINSSTGEISGTANNLGQFFSGMCIEEYIDGNLISSTEFNQIYYVDFSVSSSEVLTKELEIYPNPANNQIHIRLPQSESQLQLNVKDINGKLIKSFSELNGDQFNINTESWQGVYFLEIRNEQMLYLAKLVVL